MEWSAAGTMVVRRSRMPAPVSSELRASVASGSRSAVRWPSAGWTVERIATVAALGFPIAIAGITLARAALYPTLWAPPASALAIGAAYAFGVPLHLRHVWYTIHGARPPAALATLAGLGLLTLGGGLAHGPVALALMPLLLVSILILVPWRLGGFLYAVVLVTVEFVIAPTRTPSYSIFSALWGSAILFVPVWLASAVATLHANRAELRDRAVLRERLRIDRQIRERLTPALERIVDQGVIAATTVSRDPVASAGEVEGVIAESRTALTDARRLVAGFKESSIRAELQAGLAILDAAGIGARVVLGDDAVLASADESSRRELRSAIASILRSGPGAWAIELSASGPGAVRVRIGLDETPPARGG